MKRHNLTIGDIADLIKKTYPAAHGKITRKKSPQGKISLFDIEEARTIVLFVIKTEQNSLKERYGESWKEEWDLRWGHIKDWFSYIFFDDMVTNVTTGKEVFP